MQYLADTVALVRHLRHGKLGDRAAEILRQADLGQHTVFLSAMSLMEVLYLSARKNAPVSFKALVARINENPNYSVISVGLTIVSLAEQVDDVPELHDRIIVATAKWLNVPILTDDSVMARSKHVTSIW